jgi:hypothetical protein
MPHSTDPESELQFDVTPVDAEPTIQHQLRIDLAAGAQLLFVTFGNSKTGWVIVTPSGTSTKIATEDALTLVIAHAAGKMLEGHALGRRVWIEDKDGNAVASGIVVRQDNNAEAVWVRPDKPPASFTGDGTYNIKAYLKDCKFKD